jgi:hypothetical protein
MEYRYVILRHQPSLYQPERESFAVLVEGKRDQKRLVFAVGRSPEPSTPMDPIGKALSVNMPEVLDRILSESLQQRQPGEDALEKLSATFFGNFQVSNAERLTDSDPIHMVAFKLFSEHVAGADQLVTMLHEASQRMLRRAGPQRLGDTFQTVVAIPEPDLPVAAD